MINYQARNFSLAAIADHVRRDDRVGALARARTAFREGRINAFDLVEVFFAVGNSNARDAVNGLRRLAGSSMCRGCAAGAGRDTFTPSRLDARLLQAID